MIFGRLMIIWIYNVSMKRCKLESFEKEKERERERSKFSKSFCD